MDARPDPGPMIAYETQARYAAGGDWVTLLVSSSPVLTLDDAFIRHDPWGRAPIELRVCGIRCRTIRDV
jgi:hypothetical protein